jgi:hypothetical protein
VPTTYPCFLCREPIDTASDEAMLVVVHRLVDDDEWGDDVVLSGSRDVLRFCSQDHLATSVSRQPLPPPVPDQDDDVPRWREALDALVFWAVALGVVACLVYGFISFVLLAQRLVP